MFEAIFTIFTIIGTACALFLIVALCAFFYLEYKQLFGDDNEK